MGLTCLLRAAQPVYRDASQAGNRLPERDVYEGVEIIRVAAWGNPRGSLIERALNAFSYLLMTGWYLFRDRKELSGVINSTNPSFLGLAALFVKLVAKLPFVTIVHDIYPDAAICLGVLKRGSLVQFLPYQPFEKLAHVLSSQRPI